MLSSLGTGLLQVRLDQLGSFSIVLVFLPSLGFIIYIEYEEGLRLVEACRPYRQVPQQPARRRVPEVLLVREDRSLDQPERESGAARLQTAFRTEAETSEVRINQSTPILTLALICVE